MVGVQFVFKSEQLTVTVDFKRNYSPKSVILYAVFFYFRYCRYPCRIKPLFHLALPPLQDDNLMKSQIISYSAVGHGISENWGKSSQNSTRSASSSFFCHAKRFVRWQLKRDFYIFGAQALIHENLLVCRPGTGAYLSLFSGYFMRLIGANKPGAYEAD